MPRPLLSPALFLGAGLAVCGLVATAGPALAGSSPAKLGAPPPGHTAADAASVNLGAQFTVSATTWATGVRFYQSTGNTGPHTGTLWSAQGVALATTTFPASTATGWQRASFATPVQLTPQTTYTVSYLAPHGHYDDVEGAFADGTRFTAGAAVQTRGVYAYSSSAAFPTSSWHDSNYFVAALTSAKRPGGGTATPPTTTPTPPSTPTPPTTTPTPPAADWPAAHPAAGTPAGQILVPMAGGVIRTPGTVIDGRAISGSLDIQAEGVVIRNSRISGSGYWGVFVRSGSATITDTTISGFENGVTGDRYTADGVEVTATLADGFKIGSHVLIENSWCHDLATVPGAHADCGQVQSGVVDATVRHNWFDPGNPDGNSALFLAPSLGPSSPGPLTVTDNVLGGGNYTVFCVDGDYGRYRIDHISITGNVFLRNARYGPVDVNVPVTAYGNTWRDTGAPVTIG